MSYHHGSDFLSPLHSRSSHIGSDKQLRVLLYSHDTVGLGHLRRNLAIAGEIAATFPNASIQILTGSPCDSRFKLPRNTELIKIPPVFKDSEGQYATRNFSASLEDTIEFRRKMLVTAFELFQPQLIIVDHQLTGLHGEAMDMLRAAKSKGVQIIFGLRDIKDSPEAVRRAWDTNEARWALNDCYDRICVYGMQKVFDPRAAYAPFLNKIKNVDFTGYIVPKVTKALKKPLKGKRKKVLVTFGGGGDGERRAVSYLEALATGQAHWDSHIITGPLMAMDVVGRLRIQAKRLEPLGSIQVYRFHRQIPALLRQVDAVVSMAGYNSCAEILQSGTPAVLLPRSFPRQEQLIRATRLADMGWVSMLSEEEPDPDTLFSKVASAVDAPRHNRGGADLNGLGRLCQIIAEQFQTAGCVEFAPRPARLFSGAD